MTDVSGERIRALRHAREVVDEFHWRGMAVPPVYARMSDEFKALVASGAYAAWLSDSGTPRHRAVRDRLRLGR